LKIITWLGLVDIFQFQTFEDLESVKDKEADTGAMREILEGSTVLAQSTNNFSKHSDQRS